MLECSEVFTSFQGEALGIGKLSLFIRLTGCNLSCPWCDTKEKINTTNVVIEDLAQLKELLEQSPNVKNIVVTGGEPMLKQKSLIPYLQWCTYEGNYYVEIETNGTIPIQAEIYLNANIHFNISPKLYMIDHYLVKEPPLPTNNTNYILKIVVSNEEDVEKVDKLCETWEVKPHKVYLMPNSTTYIDYIKNSEKVLLWAKQHGYNFSPRLQYIHYFP